MLLPLHPPVLKYLFSRPLRHPQFFKPARPARRARLIDESPRLRAEFARIGDLYLLHRFAEFWKRLAHIAPRHIYPPVRVHETGEHNIVRFIFRKVVNLDVVLLKLAGNFGRESLTLRILFGFKVGGENHLKAWGDFHAPVANDIYFISYLGVEDPLYENHLLHGKGVEFIKDNRLSILHRFRERAEDVHRFYGTALFHRTDTGLAPNVGLAGLRIAVDHLGVLAGKVRRGIPCLRGLARAGRSVEKDGLSDKHISADALQVIRNRWCRRDMSFARQTFFVSDKFKSVFGSWRGGPEFGRLVFKRFALFPR